MSRFKYFIYTTLVIILLLLTLPYVWDLIKFIFLSDTPILDRLDTFKWAAAGTAAALIIGQIFKKNLKWLMTFSHELTHIIVALMFFRKVHSFNAESGTGNVVTSGTSRNGLIPMALAPYCLPIFTYLLLFLRPLMNANGLWIFDIIIGISIAFHCGCFWSQTGKYQTDINQYPLFFSYIYIYTCRLVNCCIIIAAFVPGYNVFTSIWELLCALYDNVVFFGIWVYDSVNQMINK